jgi:hypothetical protein
VTVLGALAKLTGGRLRVRHVASLGHRTIGFLPNSGLSRNTGGFSTLTLHANKCAVSFCGRFFLGETADNYS